MNGASDPPAYSQVWQDTLAYQQTNQPQAPLTWPRPHKKPSLASLLSLSRRPKIVPILKFNIDFQNLSNISMISICHNYMFQLKMNQDTPHTLTFIQDSPYGGMKILYTIQVHPKAVTFYGI